MDSQMQCLVLPHLFLVRKLCSARALEVIQIPVPLFAASLGSHAKKMMCPQAAIQSFPSFFFFFWGG